MLLYSGNCKRIPQIECASNVALLDLHGPLSQIPSLFVMSVPVFIAAWVCTYPSFAQLQLTHGKTVKSKWCYLEEIERYGNILSVTGSPLMDQIWRRSTALKPVRFTEKELTLYIYLDAMSCGSNIRTTFSFNWGRKLRRHT